MYFRLIVVWTWKASRDWAVPRGTQWLPLGLASTVRGTASGFIRYTVVLWYMLRVNAGLLVLGSVFWFHRVKMLPEFLMMSDILYSFFVKFRRAVSPS